MEQEAFQVPSCTFSDNMKLETWNLMEWYRNRHFIPAFVVG